MADQTVTGIAALELFLASERAEGTYEASAYRHIELFIARCHKGTGVTVTYDSGDGCGKQTRSGGFDLLTWDGDDLLDPIYHNPMSGCFLVDFNYTARSSRLTLDLDEGETITLTVDGASAAAAKPIKIPAPKSDIAGLAAIGQNITFLEGGIAQNYRQRYRDTEDRIIVSQARDDIAGLRAFQAVMTSGHVAVNGKGPLPFEAAVQWARKGLYVMGKKICPEVGNVTYDPTTGTLSIYEDDKGRETLIQVVAAPEALPMAA